MKYIPYTEKQPRTATTTYYEISTGDRTWLLDQCRRLITADNEYRSVNNPLSDVLNKGNPHMPRRSVAYGGGRNSARSICEGVIDNFGRGQYDISIKQAPGIEVAFELAHSIIPDFEPVKFGDAPDPAEGAEVKYEDQILRSPRDSGLLQVFDLLNQIKELSTEIIITVRRRD